MNLAETVELRSATPSLNDFALELSVAIPDVRLGTLEFNVLSPVLIWFAPSVYDASPVLSVLMPSFKVLAPSASVSAPSASSAEPS